MDDRTLIGLGLLGVLLLIIFLTILGAIVIVAFVIGRKLYRTKIEQKAIINFEEVFANEIKLIANEKLVKIFPVSTLRTRFFRLRKADGAVILTNRRVIYCTKGYFGDDELLYSEVGVDTVGAIKISVGYHFDALALIVIYGGSIIGSFAGVGFFEGLLVGFIGLIWPFILLFIFLKWWKPRLRKYNDFRKGRGLEAETVWQGLKGIFWPIKKTLYLRIGAGEGVDSAVEVALPEEFWLIDVSSYESPLDDMHKINDEIGRLVYSMKKGLDYEV